jgi:hypothetical protein
MIAQNNKSLMLQKKRRMLLIMPILIVPALALLFSILGGGTATANNKTDGTGKDVSADFPSGIIKDSKDTKYKITEENTREELKLKEEQDKSIDSRDFNYSELSLASKKDTIVNSKLLGSSISNEKLKQMSDAYQQGVYETRGNGITSTERSMFSERNTNQNAPQNFRGEQRTKSYNTPPSYNTAAAPKSKFNITYANNNEQPLAKTNNNFANDGKRAKKISFVRAVIHGDQSIKSGTLAKMHLLEDVQIDNMIIPKNTIIHGQGTGSGMERISIVINSISINEAIVSVQWLVYDTDGNEGIHVPGYGKDRQDVRNQTVDDGTNEVNNAAGSILADNRVASTGVRMATNLFRNKSSKKRLPKVDLTSGYQVLIGIEQ